MGLGLGVLILASAAFLQQSVSSYGFPDGHRTGLERAYLELWCALRVPVLVLGFNFLALGAVAHQRDVRIWFRVSLTLAALLVAGGLAATLLLRRLLDDGQGAPADAAPAAVALIGGRPAD